jgi:periplasmic protein TonB
MSRRELLPPSPASRASGDPPHRTETLAHWLIRQAARRAPPSLSERLAEEWLADLAQRPGRGSRLRHALGCCWATSVIAYEYCAPALAAPSGGAASRTLTVGGEHGASFFSRRIVALLLIACLHGIVLFALESGLLQRMTESTPDRMDTVVVSEPQAHEIPPPLPRPDLAPARVEIPAPDLALEIPAGVDAIASVAPEQSPSATSPASSAPAVLRVPGGPAAGFPNTEDYYPAAAKRLGETGIAAVRVCVNGNGRLGAEPTIAQPSGSARLDEAALRLAKAGSGHYRPTIEDGRPVSSCFPFRIRFELRN